MKGRSIRRFGMEGNGGRAVKPAAQLVLNLSSLMSVTYLEVQFSHNGLFLTASEYDLLHRQKRGVMGTAVTTGLLSSCSDSIREEWGDLEAACGLIVIEYRVAWLQKQQLVVSLTQARVLHIDSPP